MSIENECSSYEEIAARIEDPSVKVVSFDIFDTLLLRPVPNDEIKFNMLDSLFYRNTSAQIPFAKVRMRAESILRRKIIRGEDPREDFLLSDIYRVIEEVYRIPHETILTLCHGEEQLELHLCRARNFGKMLMEHAKERGKNVILISDMYLSSSLITQILEKNGISDWKHLYVSSEEGLRKPTGNLYRKVCADLSEEGIEPDRILHIGDNYETDFVMARKSGMQSVFVPSAGSVYENSLCAHHPEKVCRDLVDWEKAAREPGIAVSRRMAANLYFDNPFRTFREESAYNADPYFVGYAALGPEVLGLVRWIADNCRRDHIARMFFLSRDGFLPMLVYDRYRKYHPELPPSQYIHASRRALLPAMIARPQDLFDLPTDMTRQTPRKLMKLLQFCRKDSASRIKEEDPDRSFDPEGYEQFLSEFILREYDPQAHANAVEAIRRYFSAQWSGEPAAVFDMGYSGRISTAIHQAVDRDFAVYFFHGDGSRQFHSAARSGIPIRTFLDFNPYMEATLREYAYLEAAPSCVGYDPQGHPLFDQGPADGYTETVSAMQSGAVDFADDFLHFFGEYESAVSFRGLSAAIPFESFLRRCTDVDRRIYRDILIDDELWGGRRDIPLEGLMQARLRKLPAYAE